MGFRSFSFVACLFLLLYPHGFVTCLYEDQAGTFDWNQQYIGNIKFSLSKFENSHKRFFFGSERNVIAAVNNRDGSIVWRQVLEDEGTLLNLQLCGHYLVSLSTGTCVILRVWDSQDGSILWEKVVADDVRPVSMHSDARTGLIVIASSGPDGTQFSALNLQNGNVFWSSEASRPWGTNPDNVWFSSALVNPRTEKIQLTLLLEIHSSQGSPIPVGAITLSASKREHNIISVKELKNDISLRGSEHHCITNYRPSLLNGDFSETTIICAHHDLQGRTYLKTTLLSNQSSSSSQTEWRQMDIPQVSARILKLDEGHFIVTSPSGSGAVYELSDTGSPIMKYPVANGQVACVAILNDRRYLFAGFHQSGEPFRNFNLTIVDFESGSSISDLPSRQWTIADHHGSVESISAFMFIDPNGLPSFRLLVQTEDQSVQVIKQSGQQQWLREEALASIIGVEVVDLPVSDSQAKMEEEFGHTNNLVEMFVKRLRTQAVQLWAYVKYCVAELPRLLVTVLSSPSSAALIFGERRFLDRTKQSALNGQLSGLDIAGFPPHLQLPTQSNPSNETSDEKVNGLQAFLTRDDFNIHKMFVVATAAGKLFGMESERGRVVWEHFIPSASIMADGKVSLFQQRNTAHFPLPPLMTLLLRSKQTGLPMLYSFNPITGVPSDIMPGDMYHLNANIIQAVLRPGPVTEATDYVRPILMLDASTHVQVYPQTYSKSLSTPGTPPIFIFVVESKAARLTGYRVQHKVDASPKGDESTPGEVIFEASRVWRMRLKGESGQSSTSKPHVIVAAAGRPQTEHIYSAGRVLGDRSVLYKYLNPNLIAVLTAGGDSAAQTNSINVYLIDVVVGRILYSATHHRCGGPVSLVHSENWIVYTYYNYKSLRNEVTVLELFEPTTTRGPSSPDDLCASYLVPGPWQLFLRNILPTSWLFGFSSTSSVASTENFASGTGMTKAAVHSSSRPIFSSLYRTTDASGICSSTLENSLVPQVLQQSYILSTPPVAGAASVSLTERGITSKSIIFALQKGALIELPKTFFDPRRTLDMTSELMEEGVMPYTPVLPLSDLAVISYNQSVLGVRSVRTAMTGLESTSLVFAYGLDIFFTRVAPSQTYDLLKEDFDYTAIATVTLGMIVASVVTHKLAARRAVFRAWS
ncbi:unnamed protein product [Calicophoron daubneyi]|uniref:ER membrane protein complex subunit 1 n=1 Tax=Calicophoron daubneyi TaxID=300641 RepID=A0AAV2T4L7_CALDB